MQQSLLFCSEQSGGEKLFVGNLPFDATEAELWNLFSAFGTVSEVVILGAGRSQSGQGCAFVKFTCNASTAEAISRLDGKVALRQSGPKAGALMEVRLAKASNHQGDISIDQLKAPAYQPKLGGGCVRLFVGNLPVDVTTTELNDFFISNDIHIIPAETFLMTGKIHQNNAVCAFVVATSGEDASRAIKKIDNRLCLRCNTLLMRVKLANDGPSKTKRNNQVYQSKRVNENIYTAPTSLSSWEPAYDYENSKEPSIRTYHPYMMMPQSMHYGPLSIVPGDEPWRNNGIYSFKFATPYMGQ